MSDPQFDIVVFGASSFVGQILSRYLAAQYGAGGELRWTIAGRSEHKLRQLRASLGLGDAELPLMLADAADETALKALCAQTRVVISTVGPYAFYGEPLIKVCAETGTDYCDLTGEVQWVRQMIQRYEQSAQASGARIVHCCGFDSIPSDLGVHFLQRQAQQRFGQPCNEVKMRVKAMRGGLSGGTVASLLNVVKEAAADAQLRRELADPYSLCPPEHPRGTRQHSVKAAEHDADFNAWAAPFVMAAINTRVVQRSNALSSRAYGEDFRYDEAVLTGAGYKGRLSALALACGLGAFMAAGAIKPTRWLLERFVVPKPGEGPSEESQLRGFYDLRFVGRTADGKVLRVKVGGDRDPGYGSTAKMLGEAAICLARDIAKADQPGGFWTPATLLGDKLVARLQAHAGLQFEVLEAADARDGSGAVPST